MEAIYGFISNAVGIASTYPIDVIKTNYQVGGGNSIRDTIKRIYATKGARGFYSGIAPSLKTDPIFWSIYFGVNKMINTKFDLKQNNYREKVLTSYVSANIGSVFASPFFVIKTRMQVNQMKYADCVREINKTGMKTYFKGISSTFMNNGKIGIQFPLYDCMKDYSGSVLLSSIASRLISSTIFYPFDLFRTIQRTSDNNASIMQIAKQCVKNNGIRGMYRGVMLYNIVSTPSFIVMINVYELFQTAE